MPAAMATVDEVELLPDADQHKLLSATLERVNRASNAARAAALQQQHVRGRAAARDREGGDRAGQAARRLRAPGHRPGRGVAAAPRGQAAEVLDVPVAHAARRRRSSGTAPTGSRCSPPSGRRTISVRVDRSRGDLRPPLAGRPATLVYRNGEFELLGRPTSSASPTTTDAATTVCGAESPGESGPARVADRARRATSARARPMTARARRAGASRPGRRRAVAAHAPDSRHDPLAARDAGAVDRDLGIDRRRVS